MQPSTANGLFKKRTRSVSRTDTDDPPQGTNFSYSLGAWSGYSEVACFFNKMQALISSAKTAIIGGSSGSYTVANMETNFGLLYQLLKNLENADYGKDFEDPLCNNNGEHPGGGTYNANQINWFKAGSSLNLISNEF